MSVRRSDPVHRVVIRGCLQELGGAIMLRPEQLQGPCPGSVGLCCGVEQLAAVWDRSEGSRAMGRPEKLAIIQAEERLGWGS